MASLTDVPTTVTLRELPAEEWDRLRELPFGQNGLPDPRLAVVLVAETRDGRIVGIWAAMTQVFLDGLWVAPELRGNSWIAAKLLRGMKSVLRRLGVMHSFTCTQATEVLCLATKAGFQRIPGDLLFLDLSRELEPPT